MNKLIYGSKAAKFWFPDFREPKDLDIISKEDYWIDSFQYILDNNKHPVYADPKFLFTIKVSHAAWDIHWDKTMHDIVFLKNKGCQLDQELYQNLYKDWTEYHGRKKVRLNMKNDEFFTNKITRKYDHDYLHEIFGFYDRPLHERIRKDLDSPMCSKELFDRLSFEEQIKCALEEIQVIATERWVIPNKIGLNHAKYLAMKQLIISMSTGWFNLFLILNFETLIRYEVETWKTKLEQLKM